MKNPVHLDMFSKLTHPLYRRLFFLAKLPLALIVGLKVHELSEVQSVVSVPFKYWTKNPFQSMYFACLAMAGEFCGGVLVAKSVHDSSENISMLVIDAHILFTKKAKERVYFTCSDGQIVRKTIDEAILSREGEQVVTTSIGKTREGEELAKLMITWSIKVK